MNAGRRVWAYAIDCCVFACWAGLVFAFAWFSQGGELAWPASPWLGQALGFLLTALPFGLYFALMEGSGWQATLGKRAMRLGVVTARGGRPSRRRTLGRAAVKLLPWEAGHMATWQMIALAEANEEIPAWLLVAACLAMAAAGWFLVTLWSASGRTPYDRLCGTRVESVRAGPA